MAEYDGTMGAPRTSATHRRPASGSLNVASRRNAVTSSQEIYDGAPPIPFKGHSLDGETQYRGPSGSMERRHEDTQNQFSSAQQTLSNSSEDSERRDLPAGELPAIHRHSMQGSQGNQANGVSAQSPFGDNAVPDSQNRDRYSSSNYSAVRQPHISSMLHVPGDKHVNDDGVSEMTVLSWKNKPRDNPGQRASDNISDVSADVGDDRGMTAKESQRRSVSPMVQHRENL